MTTTSDFLRQLRTVAARQAHAALSDRQLLERFLHERSETSFAALVQRHGPMVLSVCRRVLRHAQDAEDAFQAAFLILARKAGSIRRRDSLSSWLHGVAYHSAECLKAKARRRAVHEGRVAPSPPADAMDDITWRELRSALDEELQRLPEKYRAPLVLCYLEAQTQEEAARQLGWSKNTFGRRLNQARQLLAQRLTRRGLTLPAALTVPLLIDGAAAAAVPPLLAANTVRAGLAAAMGSTGGGIVSAQAITLAESSATSLLTKKVSLAVLLLASLTLGLGGVLTHRIVSSRSSAEAPQTPKPPPPPARSASKDQAIDIKGRVLDPDGKPFAGARLFLFFDSLRKKTKAVVRAASDKEGRFSFTAKPADFDEIGKATLAVTANGFGPDWVEIATKNKDAITLRLVKDDVPIRGRILNLEGRPVAKVTVRVLELLHGRDYYSRSIAATALDAPMQAITGADGRFQLRGLGRERLVYFQIEGDTIERIRCWALTSDGKNLDVPKGLLERGELFYPARFDHVAAPTKPIIGTVRDKASGKPLAGITVHMKRWINSAITDERGRYRIVGNPKEREYSVTAVGKPYFVVRKGKIADTPGLEPLVVDLELQRGIEITGRIFNKDTGETIQGEIIYYALADNPYLKKVSGLDRDQRNFIDARGHAKLDGSFFVIALPGPGFLGVIAYPDDYHKQRPAEWNKVVPYTIAPPLFHAWVAINPAEKGPQSLRREIALAPAKPIPGQLLDPEGKPLGGFFAAGLTGSPLTVSSDEQLHEKSTFQVRGFDPGRSRTLIFIHPQKKLGKVVVVRETPREPLQVRLAPLGAAAGRVLDAKGRPRAGLQVRAELSRDDIYQSQALFLFEIGLRRYHLDPSAQTDAAGKFRLDGLMPGLKYTLLVGEGERKSLTRIVIRRENTTVESGKTKDVGDLKKQ